MARIKRGPGNLSKKVDRNKFHVWLWEQAKNNRNNILKLDGKTIADEWGVSIYTVSRLMNEFSESGRTQKIAGKWKIIDPAVWGWKHDRSPLMSDSVMAVEETTLFD